MAIAKLEIVNFTAFDRLVLEACAGVNVLVGENGTGKTHLLKVLYALCTDDVKIEYESDDYLPSARDYCRLNEVFRTSSPKDLLRKCAGASSPDGTVAVVKTDNDLKHAVFAYKSEDSDRGSFGSYNMTDIPAIFIPAKEMLTHARLEKDFAERNLPFDATHIDILNKVGVSTVKTLSENMQSVLRKIANIIGGKVVYQNDRYFINRDREGLVDFTIEAEGYKKYGLIYRLIETGHLKPGSILLWDEPEANINPKLIPNLVEIILDLARNGVQVFLATHDYMLAKYFEVRRQSGDLVRFHSLQKTNEGVKCEHNKYFRDLSENPIIEAFDVLMDEVLTRNLGD